MTSEEPRAASAGSPLGAGQAPKDPKAPPTRQCTATSKTTGKRCGHWAMRNASVCRHHGGAAPQVRAKARERQALAAAQADADRVLAYAARSPMQDPVLVLGQVAEEALALKDAMAARVNALEEMRYAAPGAGTEQLRAEITVYERALDRVVRITDILVKHDFRAREVEIEGQKAGIVVTAVHAAVEQAGLSVQQRELFVRAFLAGIGRAPADDAPVVVGEVEAR